MRVLLAPGQCHQGSVKACHRVLQDLVAQVLQVIGIAGCMLRGSTAMSAGRLESVFLAPLLHAGAVWPRRPPWSCQGCIPPAWCAKCAQCQKSDLVIHASPLRQDGIERIRAQAWRTSPWRVVWESLSARCHIQFCTAMAKKSSSDWSAHGSR